MAHTARFDMTGQSAAKLKIYYLRLATRMSRQVVLSMGFAGYDAGAPR